MGISSRWEALGQPAEVKREGETDSSGSELTRDAGASSRASSLPPAGEGICFQRAELYDVVNSRSAAKIAGAAQKRNKHGLLFQGSIEKGAVAPLDWDEFQARFTAALARAIGAGLQETPWPELNEDEVSGLIEQYSSPEWIGYR